MSPRSAAPRPSSVDDQHHPRPGSRAEHERAHRRTEREGRHGARRPGIRGA